MWSSFEDVVIRNTMVQLKFNLDNRFVKLSIFSLGCTEIKIYVHIYSFPPPARAQLTWRDAESSGRRETRRRPEGAPVFKKPDWAGLAGVEAGASGGDFFFFIFKKK